MNAFPALGHVALTVTDLSVSRPWYARLFDASPVLDEPTDGGFHHVVFALGETLLGLHQHDAGGAGTFSELHAGLDHVSFGCSDRRELVAWAERLDRLGIPRSDVEDAAYGSGVSFRDPDGIALELFAPPG